MDKAYKANIVNFAEKTDKDNVIINSVVFEDYNIDKDKINFYIMFELNITSGPYFYERDEMEDTVCCTGVVEYWAMLTIKTSVLDEYLNKNFVLDKGNTDYIIEGDIDCDFDDIEIVDGSIINYDTAYEYVIGEYDETVKDISKWLNNHSVEIQITEE